MEFLEHTKSRGENLSKSLQTAKIEELLKTYKIHKKSFKGLKLSKKDAEILGAELFWIDIIIQDLQWLLDDEEY